MNKQHANKNSTVSVLYSFVKIVVPITILVFAAFVLTFVNLFYSIQSESNQVYEQHALRIKEDMATAVSSLFAQSFILKNDTTILQYTQEKDQLTTRNIFSAYEIIGKLQTAENTGYHPYSICIYVQSSDSILSSKSRGDAYTYFKDTYGAADFDFAQWYDAITARRYNGQWSIWSNQYLLLTDTLSNSRGNVVSMLDLDQLFADSLKHLPEHSCIQLWSLEDVLLYSSEPMEMDAAPYKTERDGKYSCFTSRCTVPDYECVLLVPEQNTFVLSKFFLRAVWFMLAIMVLYEVALVLYFLRFHYRPVKKLVGIIEHDTDSASRNEYEILEQAIFQSLQDNQEYLAHLELQKQEGIEQALLNFLSQATSGVSPELEQYFTDMNCQAYLMMSFSGGNSADAVSLLAQIQLLPAAKHVVWLHAVMLCESNFYILALRSANDAAQFRQGLGMYVSQEQNEHRQQACVLLSACKESYQDLPKAYQEVLMMARIYNGSNQHALYSYEDFYRDVIMKTETYFTPSLQKEYVDLIQQQRYDEAQRKVILFVHRMMNKDIPSSFEITKILSYLLIGDGMKATGVYGASDAEHGALRKILLAHSADALIAAMEETTELFSKEKENLPAPRNNSTHNMVADICKFIQEHFREQDLNVSSIAEAAHLSVSYCSRIFKKTTGYNVLEYLYLLRLNYAKKLLAETDKTIQTIAEEAGFSSAKRLNELMKKYEGITAKEFRSA